MNDATKVIISSDIAKDFIFFTKYKETEENKGRKREIKDDTLLCRFCRKSIVLYLLISLLL